MGRDVDPSEQAQQNDPNPRFASRTYYDLIAPVENYLARVTARIDGVRPNEERRRVVKALDLQPADLVLSVAIGTGRNIPFIARKLGPRGEIVGIDLSKAILRRCQSISEDYSPQPTLIEGTALRLPFRADQFDDVLHFGGLAAFADRERAIKEITRVAKPGATIVLSDKSHPPSRERSLRQRFQAWLKPQITLSPPVEIVPVPEGECDLSWIWGGSIYLLKFSNPR